MDYVALKAELWDKIMGEVMKKMGVLQGVQTEAGSIPTVVGRKSSCSSTPDSEPICPVMLEDLDPIALLDEPTACALVSHLGGIQIEVARGHYIHMWTYMTSKYFLGM